jgi:hypothetical protein
LNQLDADAAKSTNAWSPDTQGQIEVGAMKSSLAQPMDPIDAIFTFHDDPEAVPHYVEIREAAKTFAKVINRHAHGDDKRKALNFVRAAVMWANASIALNGRTL